MANENRFTVGKQHINLPERNIANPGTPEKAFLTALESLQGFTRVRANIENDNLLSDAGRVAKLTPAIEGLYGIVLRSVEVVENERLALVKREKDLYAVAAITTPVQIAWDLEIRDWFRSLNDKERAKFFGVVRAGEAHEYTISALMRSPVPMGLDANLEYIESIHKENRRAMFPEDWAAIETGNAGVEWAQLGMAHVVGLVVQQSNQSIGALVEFALQYFYNLAASTLASPQMIERIKQTLAAKTLDEVVVDLTA